MSLGQLIGAISPNIQVCLIALAVLYFLVILTTSFLQTAALFNPFLALMLTTFCGVTIPYATMAKFWRSWLYQLVPYTRTLSAMLGTELQ